MYRKFYLSLVTLTVLAVSLCAQPLPLQAEDRRGDAEDVQGSPVQFLSRYLQIPSVTGNEGTAGAFFADACREAGLHVRVFSDRNDSYNFAASLYPLDWGMPNVIFLTHIDVVPEGDPAMWTHPPYSGAVADGMVWGRGAIDNKGHGVMQFYALKSFVEVASAGKMPYNFTLLAVSNEEEMGSLGAEYVVNNYLQELNPVAVYGEGGAGTKGVVVADTSLVVFGIETVQKRVLWFQLETNSSAGGHGSIPTRKCPTREIVLATNALIKHKPNMVLTPTVRNMLSELADHERGIRRLAMKNAGVFLPFTEGLYHRDELLASLLTNTLALTSIRSDQTAHNQIAQGATANFDSRLLPGVDAEDFLSAIRKRIRRYNVNLVILQHPEPAVVSDQGHYYGAIEKAVTTIFPDAAVIPMLFPAVNDNRFFRRHNIPTYGITPAILSHELLMTIHNFDERIPVKAVYDGIEVYKALIRTLIGTHGTDSI